MVAGAVGNKLIHHSKRALVFNYAGAAAAPRSRQLIPDNRALSRTSPQLRLIGLATGARAARCSGVKLSDPNL